MGYDWVEIKDKNVEDACKWIVSWAAREFSSYIDYAIQHESVLTPDDVESTRDAPVEFVVHQNGVWFRRGALVSDWNPKDGLVCPTLYDREFHPERSLDASFQRWYWKTKF